MKHNKSVGAGVGLELRVNGKALLRGEYRSLNAKHGQGVVNLCRRNGREEVSALHKAQQLVDLKKFGLYRRPLRTRLGLAKHKTPLARCCMLRGHVFNGLKV